MFSHVLLAHIVITMMTSEFNYCCYLFLQKEQREYSANLVARRDRERTDDCNEIKVDKR